MTDINSQRVAAPRSSPMSSAKTAAPPAGTSERGPDVDIVSYVELFYFAYREFTGDPDAILEQYGFGRAHHRVLHFVARNPGLKVAELLVILKITKQSLARVLKQLVDEGFIVQRAGDEDRRERRLYMSAKGARLTEKLTQIQIKRIADALHQVGPGAQRHVRQFLFAMIADKDRPHVEALLKVAAAKAAPQKSGGPSE